jgi:dynein heavy chain, axonemal
LIQTFLSLLDLELEKINKFIENSPEEFATFEEKFKLTLVNGIFMFAVIWSFGAALDTQSRKPFDQAFKKLMIGDITQIKKKKNVSFPDKATLYDYFFKVKSDKLSYEWAKWTDLIDDYYPKDVRIHEIIVKTSDIARYNHCL